MLSDSTAQYRGNRPFHMSFVSFIKNLLLGKKAPSGNPTNENAGSQKQPAPREKRPPRNRVNDRAANPRPTNRPHRPDNDSFRNSRHSRKPTAGNPPEKKFESRSFTPPAEPKIFPAPVLPDDPWDPVSYSVEPKEGVTRFQEFNLPKPILHAIADLGFQYCTPIQAASLTRTMQGENVAGRAQTGTGKTAAFLIAILKRMLEHPESRPTVTGRPAALVLAPTRELVVQIVSDAQALGKYCGLRCLAVFGGCDHERQQRAIEEQPLDLIAATPGRLIDFQRLRVLSLKGVQTLVIDEADRMLDMGFIPDVRKIIRQLPEQRQTLLFSATLGQEVMTLARQWMPNPVEIAVDPEYCPAETIKQIIYPISTREKFTVLYNLLQRHAGERILIFRNRKYECEELARQLQSHEIDAAELSGDVDQKKRLRIIDDFKSGKVKVVVATDVAARGLQIDEITLVVNYDFPYEADDYIHRIGRTGRAGEKGTAVSFACEDESFIIPDIEKLIGFDLPCQMPEEALFAEPPAPTRDIPRRAHHAPGGSAPRRGGGHFGGPPRRRPPFRNGGNRRT